MRRARERQERVEDARGKLVVVSQLRSADDAEQFVRLRTAATSLRSALARVVETYRAVLGPMVDTRPDAGRR